jgi:Helix-turn-helix domain
MSEPPWISSPQQFISVKDAANFIGCHVDRIYDYIGAKIIPVKIIKTPYKGKRGRAYLIPKKKFLEWAGFSEDQ